MAQHHQHQRLTLFWPHAARHRHHHISGASTDGTLDQASSTSSFSRAQPCPASAVGPSISNTSCFSVSAGGTAWTKRERRQLLFKAPDGPSMAQHHQHQLPTLSREPRIAPHHQHYTEAFPLAVHSSPLLLAKVPHIMSITSQALRLTAQLDQTS